MCRSLRLNDAMPCQPNLHRVVKHGSRPSRKPPARCCAHKQTRSQRTDCGGGLQRATSRVCLVLSFGRARARVLSRLDLTLRVRWARPHLTRAGSAVPRPRNASPQTSDVATELMSMFGFPASVPSSSPRTASTWRNMMRQAPRWADNVVLSVLRNQRACCARKTGGAWGRNRPKNMASFVS